MHPTTKVPAPIEQLGLNYVELLINKVELSRALTEMYSTAVSGFIKKPLRAMRINKDACLVQFRKELGSGTYKNVYHGIYYNWTTKTAKEVAISVFKKNDRELNYVSLFNDHSIPTLFFNKKVIVREKYDFELTEIINQKYVTSLHDKLVMALEVAEDLSSLHEKGYFHGDIAPWNVLVKVEKIGQHLIKSYKAHITDFGLTCKKEDVKLNLQSKVGNSIYMPPEAFKYQLTGENIPLDADAWEVWALGRLFMQLLCPTLATPWPKYFGSDRDHRSLEVMREHFWQQRHSPVEKSLYLQILSKPVHSLTSTGIEPLVVAMLNPLPAERPPFTYIIGELKGLIRECGKVSGLGSRAIKHSPLSKNELLEVIHTIQRNSWDRFINNQISAKKTGLPASFYVLSPSCFYIDLKNELGSGGFKKVIQGLKFNAEKKRVYRIAEARMDWPCPVAQVDKLFAHQCQKQFVGVHGIVEKEDSLSIFYSRYDMDLLHFCKQGQIIRDQVILPGAIFRMGVQICEDLITLHRTGFCHGDLHPRNILVKLSHNGRIKAHLHDFGLSYPKDEVMDYIEDYDGVSDIWAPEIFTYHFKKVRVPGIDGEKLDVWALGLVLATLFELSIKLPYVHFKHQALDRYLDGQGNLTKQEKNDICEGFEYTVHHDSTNPIHCLIIKMLNPDPVARIALPDVLVELTMIGVQRSLL